MKYRVIISTLLIITLFQVGCKTKKNSCVNLSYGTEDVSMVEGASDMTMIAYQLKEGPLKGYILEAFVNKQLKEYELNLVNPDPNKQLLCNKLDLENWKLEEEKNHEAQTMTFHLQAKAACGNTTYCFDLQYEGSMNRMRREIHQEDAQPKQPEESPAPDKE